jgi:hypothetical protein
MDKADEKRIGPIGIGLGVMALVVMIAAAVRLPTIPAFAAAMAGMAVIQGLQASAHHKAGRQALSLAARGVALLFLLAAAGTVLAGQMGVAPSWVRGATLVAAGVGFVSLTLVEIWLHLRAH